jgi:hypothetical protein
MINSKVNLQEKVLGFLADKIDDFYLAGGTALSRYYFQHRISEDLDFFSHDYSRLRIQEIIGYLKTRINGEIEIIAEQTIKKSKVRMAIYYLTQKKAGLKIDFVEDYLEFLQPCRKIDGIFVLSLPDIYLRKIYALIGTIDTVDLIGRRISAGRQEAKDFIDLFFLSHTFKRLSIFATEHCSLLEREALIHWYRTYDRMNIKTGLLDLKLLPKTVQDFQEMELHFKKEIDKLLEMEIGRL